jgi:hypothetical protein
METTTIRKIIKGSTTGDPQKLQKQIQAKERTENEGDLAGKKNTKIAHLEVTLRYAYHRESSETAETFSTPPVAHVAKEPVASTHCVVTARQ